jgi:mannose-6-phosphate isomerase-like protein (cupin superfamily)
MERIRVPSAQTMGAYSVIEIVADPGNGVPLHIHNKEEEHFIVLEGTLDIANGDRRWDAPAATNITVKRGVPHAWCNPSDTPLHMLVVFSPGQIDGLFRARRVSTTSTRSRPSRPTTARSLSDRLCTRPPVRSTHLANDQQP